MQRNYSACGTRPLVGGEQDRRKYRAVALGCRRDGFGSFVRHGTASQHHRIPVSRSRRSTRPKPNCTKYSRCLSASLFQSTTIQSLYDGALGLRRHRRCHRASGARCENCGGHPHSKFTGEVGICLDIPSRQIPAHLKSPVAQIRPNTVRATAQACQAGQLRCCPGKSCPSGFAFRWWHSPDSVGGTHC